MNDEFRLTRIIRNLPVRDLTPAECRRLLVHNHGGNLSPERRRAYLFKGSENPLVYFLADQLPDIEKWIANEVIDSSKENYPN